MSSLSKNWAKYEFGQVFEVLSSKKHQINKSNYLETGTLPVIDQGKKRIVGYTNDESKKYVNSKGVIVFGDHTLTFKYIDFDFVVGADGTKVLKLIDSENFSLKFLFYQFLSRQYKILGYRRHFKIVKKDDFTIPTLKEQKRIVAKIDTLFAKIDKAISLTEESLKQAENLLPSVLKEVFEKGKEDGWEEKIFDDLKESNSLGLVRNVKQQSLDYSYDYVKMNNVTNDNKFTFQNITRVNADEKEVQKYKLKKGDFLFNTRNSFELVGKSCVFNDEKNNVLFNNNLMRVRFKNDTNSNFILYQFSSPFVKHQLGKIKSGTTNVSAIYYKSLKDVKLLITSTEHQEELVVYFDEVSEYSNQTQSKLEEQLAYLKQLKSSILSKAFKGEL